MLTTMRERGEVTRTGESTSHSWRRSAELVVERDGALRGPVAGTIDRLHGEGVRRLRAVRDPAVGVELGAIENAVHVHLVEDRVLRIDVIDGLGPEQPRLAAVNVERGELPGAVGPVVSVLGCVVAVTGALGADAFRDGSTATTVNEYVVAPRSRRTVTVRSPVHRTFAREPFAKMR
jgi:hypothetical protein